MQTKKAQPQGRAFCLWRLKSERVSRRLLAMERDLCGALLELTRKLLKLVCVLLQGLDNIQSQNAAGKAPGALSLIAIMLGLTGENRHRSHMAVVIYFRFNGCLQ
jgi:hypothetical protein